VSCSNRWPTGGTTTPRSRRSTTFSATVTPLRLVLLWVKYLDLKNRTRPASRPRATPIGCGRCRVHVAGHRVAHPGHGYHRHRFPTARTPRSPPGHPPPSTPAHAPTATSSRQAPSYRDTPNAEVKDGLEQGVRRDASGNENGNARGRGSYRLVPSRPTSQRSSRPRCARLCSRPEHPGDEADGHAAEDGDRQILTNKVGIAAFSAGTRSRDGVGYLGKHRSRSLVNARTSH
jgi:hypothetical protein